MESQTYFGPLYARLADAKPVSFSHGRNFQLEADPLLAS
jgi:hypothetical protein